MTTTPLSPKHFDEVLNGLEKGIYRAASPSSNGEWVVHPWVKEAILEAFKQGYLRPIDDMFIDKHTMMPRKFQVRDQVRIVPYGSAVRRGSYVSKGVVIMPPSYINVGAYVDSGTMVDSHVLVGSCAQVGKNVHLSAGVQIGGVLEPIGQKPVIIEDDAFIGAGCLIVEGRMVQRGAVLAPGVTLSKGTPVFDLVHERQLGANEPIPPLAVVVPGSRPSQNSWAQAQQLHLQCALIVKYRDEKSHASLMLEEALRI